jgi:hypothetical protein
MLSGRPRNLTHEARTAAAPHAGCRDLESVGGRTGPGAGLANVAGKEALWSFVTTIRSLWPS